MIDTSPAPGARPDEPCPDQRRNGGDGPADGGAADASPADGRAVDDSPADGRAHDHSPADGSAADARPADGGAVDDGPAAHGPSDLRPDDHGREDRKRRARVDPGARPRVIDPATHKARVDSAARHHATRCDAHFEARLRERLAAWEVHSIHRADHKRAAVALAITDEGPGAGLAGLPRHGGWSDKAALILTRRAGGLRRHAGQWALPGGRIDDGETPEQAVLRELSEEVGLTLESSAILGRLDDYASRSGYIMTPVVVWAGPARDMHAQPDEVKSIHRIRISEFMRPDSPILEDVPHSLHPVLRMHLGSHWIAAPTGAIVYQFVEACVVGRATRVAHFEQPMFAWK